MGEFSRISSISTSIRDKPWLIDLTQQHDVRSQSTSPTTDDLTLFDNSADGTSQTASSSTGKYIHVDTGSMTATLTHTYEMPNGLISSSQGSTQPLGNGNTIVGWGSIPYVTEYDANDNVLFHTHFGVLGDE